MSDDEDQRPVGAEVQALEGWLEKHGDWLGQWNRRWFRLKGPVLSYKVDPAQPDKGMCHIHGLRTENKGMHIRVWTETSDSWLLRAPDAEAHTRWLDALKTAVLAHENRVTSQPSGILRSDSVGSSLDGASTDGEVRPRVHHRSRSARRTSRGVSPTDSVAAAAQAEMLRGTVKKRSAWLRQWNQRFVVVDGVDLVYSEKEDGKLRGRHTIVSVDGCEDPAEVKIVTSNGEDFHLRYTDAETARHWVSVIRNSLQTTMVLRWQPVEIACKDGSSVFLRAANHSACIYDRDGENHVSLVFFGGMSSTLPASAKAEEKAILCSEVLMVKLSGDHDCVKLNVKAFQEGPGANVRPGPREGHASVIAAQRLYIHGGANKSAVLGDMWSIDLSAPNAEWTRITDPHTQPPVVPVRCGHALVNVDDDIWFIGGFDSHGKAVQDVTCFDPVAKTSTAMPPLPAPRARHACATNSGGSILCVGGTESRHLEDACNLGFVLHRGETAWQRVEWTGAALPKMVSPCLTACGRKGWILVGSDGVGPVQVYFLQPSKSNRASISVEALGCAGDTPRMHHGLSAHRCGDYLYVAGDCSLPPIGPAVRRLLLPPSVVKNAPRIPSMGSMGSMADLAQDSQPHAQ